MLAAKRSPVHRWLWLPRSFLEPQCWKEVVEVPGSWSSGKEADTLAAGTFSSYSQASSVLLLPLGTLLTIPSTPQPSRSSQPSSFLPLPCQPHTEGSPPASSQGLSRNEISHVLRGNMFIHLSLVCPWVPLWEFWKAAPDGPAPPPPSY